jgi:hypothetical protein
VKLSANITLSPGTAAITGLAPMFDVSAWFEVVSGADVAGGLDVTGGVDRAGAAEFAGVEVVAFAAGSAAAGDAGISSGRIPLHPLNIIEVASSKILTNTKFNSFIDSPSETIKNPKNYTLDYTSIISSSIKAGKPDFMVTCRTSGQISSLWRLLLPALAPMPARPGESG